MSFLDRMRRQILLRLNEVEAVVPVDEEAEIARCYVQAHVAQLPPARLLLRPPRRASYREHETGPPCPACGVILSRAELLAACTECLVVVHQHCWQLETPCRSARCASDF